MQWKDEAMGVVNVNAEMMIASVIETMLPRFSDERLGVGMSLDMDLSDYGFDHSGSKRERKQLSVRRFPSFLFIRPSNYTQVYYCLPSPDAVGLDLSPLWSRKELVWTLVCDHDSCWRDAVGSELSKIYFAMSKKFDGRKIGDKDIRPCDLSQNIFPSFSSPAYVRIEKCEFVNPKAARYSDESRLHRISIVGIDFSKIVSDEKGKLHLKG
jgi:hypothetical protein